MVGIQIPTVLQTLDEKYISTEFKASIDRNALIPKWHSHLQIESKYMDPLLLKTLGVIRSYKVFTNAPC